MAVWYLDSENEITEAVARLRGVTDEHVVFVVPPGSRIATGRINFKLLAREAETRGLGLAVASPDAQVRAMAASAGVLALPSVAEAEAALERGDSPADAAATDASTTEAPDDAEAAAVAAVAAAGGPGPSFLRRNRRRISITAVAVMGIATVGVVASLQTLPTARIVLTPRTAALGPLTITVTALADLAQPDIDAREVPAVTLPVPLSVDARVDASGSRTSRARARGSVVFRAPTERDGLDIPALTGVYADDVEFRTTETVYLQPTADGSEVEAVVAVEAVADGPAGNLPAGAIDAVPTLAAQDITVTNPEPTAGGRLETSTFVTREDYERAAVDVRNLLRGALTSYQREPSGLPAGLSVFAETATPGEVVLDPPVDELVGATGSEFRLGGRMAAEVLAVDEAAVTEMVERALVDEVPQDMAVVPQTVAIDTSVGVPDADGIRFEARVRAVAQQVIDEDTLVARVAGLPVSEARAILGDLGATTVSVWPEFLGDLPGDRSRIQLEIQAPSTAE